MGTLSPSGDRANPNDPEVPGGEAQPSLCLPTAAFLHWAAAPALGAGELPAGLGLELWKGSLEAGEHAQSEIWDLETKAPEGKGESFKQKAFPFPRQC